MKKYLLGILMGAIGGIINTSFLLFAPEVEYMVYISTFTTWIVIGLMIVSSDFKMNMIVKGSVIALLVSLPSLIYILNSSLSGGLWNLVNTIIFGAIIGFVIDKLNN